MFWTWLDYRPGMNFDSICQVMNDIGMDGIMLNAPTPDDYRAAIPVAHKHGIEVYAWLWTILLLRRAAYPEKGCTGKLKFWLPFSRRPFL